MGLRAAGVWLGHGRTPPSRPEPAGPGDRPPTSDAQPRPSPSRPRPDPASVYSADERPPHRPPRRPAPAPQGQAGRQLRQVPARAARRPGPHDARRPGRRARGAAARRGDAGLRDRGREPAVRAGEPADRPFGGRRPRPRGLPVDPGLRRLRHPAGAGLGGRPGPARQEGSRSPGPGCSVGPSSTSSTTSTASSTSTTSIRWTSCWPVGDGDEDDAEVREATSALA